MSGKFTASCMSTRTATLLLVVDRYSQVLGAAVHQYSQLIRNLNPSLTAMIQLKPGIPPASLNKPTHSAARRKNRMERKKNGGLRFKRVFSDAAVAPFDQIEWERRTAEITDDSGKVIFKQENIEVPKNWSPLATKIAVSKYFYGDIANGTDPYKGGRETSVRQLIHRVTRTITDWGIADGYFADAEAAETFYDELTWLCLNQHGAFNSPVWFNVGLYHQYGVGKGAGAGNYFYNRETGKAERAASQYEYPQGSACFIQSVDDTMEDIMRLAMSEAMLFKYGSGTGTDLSSLRIDTGKIERRRQTERAALVPESLRPGRERGEERRQNAARREDEHAQGLASGHRGIHRRETEGREESVGADRAGLRRQLQRRRLRLGHVSERKPERAGKRRIHGRGAGGPRMVDAPRDATASRASKKKRARCCAKSPKAP